MAGEGHGFAHYDVEAGRLLWRHDDWNAEVNVVAISPNGRTAALGVMVDGFYTYDLLAERILSQARFGSIGGLRALEYSPDGRFIAVGGYRGSVALIDAESLAVETVLTGSRLNPTVVKFSKNGRYLLGGDESTMYVWDIAQRLLVRQLGTMCIKRTFDFSDDLNYVATCRDDDVEVLDVETGARVALLTGHGSSVDAVLFAPSPCCLISVGGESGSEDSIRVWDLTERKEIQRIDLGTNFVTAMAISPDGNFLAVGGSDFVRVYRMRR